MSIRAYAASDPMSACGAALGGSVPGKAPQTSAPSPHRSHPGPERAACVGVGARPAEVGRRRELDVTATVFREGHDAVNATLVVTDPDGQERAQLMTCLNPGLNHCCPLVADREGWWSYRVEGWSDPYGTWVHDAEIKVAAGVDVELMLAEAPWSSSARGTRSRTQKAKALIDGRSTSCATQGAPTTGSGGHPSQDPGPRWPSVRCGTTSHHLATCRCSSSGRALAGAWYGSSRAAGATYDEAEHKWTSGTFRTA